MPASAESQELSAEWLFGDQIPAFDDGHICRFLRIHLQRILLASLEFIWVLLQAGRRRRNNRLEKLRLPDRI